MLRPARGRVGAGRARQSPRPHSHTSTWRDLEQASPLYLPGDHATHSATVLNSFIELYFVTL